jgi:hypothetical protein
MIAYWRARAQLKGPRANRFRIPGCGTSSEHRTMHPFRSHVSLSEKANGPTVCLPSNARFLIHNGMLATVRLVLAIRTEQK